MDNIKSYELFINESFATVNENVFSNIKDKIINKWNSLNANQKVQLADKVRDIISDTAVAARFGLFFYLLVQLVDIFLLPNFKLSNYLSWIINGMYWLIIITQLYGGKKLKDLRIQTIRAKVRELRNEFNEKWFRHIFILFGEKQKVQACLERLIEDGILTKDLIHKTHDGTILIDMTGKFEKISKSMVSTNIDIDPYGEETWNDDEEKQLSQRGTSKIDLLSFYKSTVTYEAGLLFGVQFRCLYELETFMDYPKPNMMLTFKKKEKHNDYRYRNYVKEIKPRLKQIEKAE